MGSLFGKSKTVQQTIPSLDEENEKAANKQRLLLTQGQNQGQKLNQAQGASIRKVFGN